MYTQYEPQCLFKLYFPRVALKTIHSHTELHKIISRIIGCEVYIPLNGLISRIKCFTTHIKSFHWLNLIEKFSCEKFSTETVSTSMKEDGNKQSHLFDFSRNYFEKNISSKSITSIFYEGKKFEQGAVKLVNQFCCSFKLAPINQVQSWW